MDYKQLLKLSTVFCLHNKIEILKKKRKHEDCTFTMLMYGDYEWEFDGD